MLASLLILDNDQVSIGAEGARTDTVESDDTKTTVFIAENMFEDAR